MEVRTLLKNFFEQQVHFQHSHHRQLHLREHVITHRRHCHQICRCRHLHHNLCLDHRRHAQRHNFQGQIVSIAHRRTPEQGTGQ